MGMGKGLALALACGEMRAASRATVNSMGRLSSLE